MKRYSLLLLIALSSAFACVSCVEQEKKPVGPTSGSSQLPWNTPIAGQGMGQMGMMQQNQYRR